MRAISQNSNCVVSFDLTGSGSYLLFIDDGAGGGTAKNGLRDGSEELIKSVSPAADNPGIALISVTLDGSSAYGFTPMGLSFANRSGSVVFQNQSGANTPGRSFGRGKYQPSLRSGMGFRKKRNQGGFTILEVLIAVSVFSFALLALAQMQIMAIQTNATSQQRTTAITLAQDKMEILKRLPYTQISTGNDVLRPVCPKLECTERFPIERDENHKPDGELGRGFQGSNAADHGYPMKKRFPFKPAAIKKFLKNSGFTLVELLVAMSLSGIIVSAVYSLFIHQNKSFIVQGQVTETQQNLRGALEIMGLDIKMAGFGFSTTGTASYYNGSGIVTLKSVVPTNSTTGPDSIQISYGDNALKSKLTAPMATHSDPLLVENAAGFQVNDIILISDGTNASLLQITGINALQLLHASVSGNLNPPAGMTFFPRTYLTGSWVYKLKNGSYRITNANPNHPRLEVNWAGAWTGGTFQSLAEDIEDLQIAYRDDIGIWHYTLTNSTPPVTIRDIRLNLVGRARGLDPVFSGRRPALEDRPGGILDNLRRRTLTTTFMVRNLGI